MKKLFVLVAALVLVFAASCDTKNIGTGIGPVRGPSNVTITFAAAAPNQIIEGGGNGTATVTWDGANGPFTIDINFNGACTTNVVGGTSATNTFVQNVVFVNPSTENDANYTGITVTVTDSMTGSQPGSLATPASLTVGPTPNIAPTIDNVTYADGVLTVTVSDQDDGETLAVSVTDITGLSVDANTKTAAQTGPQTAVFNWAADDVMSGGTGTTTITVDDGKVGGTATQDQAIAVAAVVPGEGVLLAVPSPSTAATGEEVVIQVISGPFPAASPFNYCNGAGVTLTAGATYVAGSFNVGAPGNDQKVTDGIWSAMGTEPTSYLVPDDFMLDPIAVTTDATLEFVGCNVTPIGGEDITVGGVILNFAVTYDAAGTKDLGFILFQDVKRTYYSSNDATEYDWADITNNMTGVPNQITIT